MEKMKSSKIVTDAKEEAEKVKQIEDNNRSKPTSGKDFIDNLRFSDVMDIEGNFSVVLNIK